MIVASRYCPHVARKICRVKKVLLVPVACGLCHTACRVHATEEAALVECMAAAVDRAGTDSAVAAVFSYFIVGLPVALLLCFTFKLGVSAQTLFVLSFAHYLDELVHDQEP